MRRYAAHLPIVEKRLALLDDAGASYQLKKRHRDASTHISLDPLKYLERLCAIAQRPDLAALEERLRCRGPGIRFDIKERERSRIFRFDAVGATQRSDQRPSP
jgi:hypothetical protein